jgi:hypothetical protein
MEKTYCMTLIFKDKKEKPPIFKGGKNAKKRAYLLKGSYIAFLRDQF